MSCPTSREIILANAAFACEGRIGLDFDGGRLSDIAAFGPDTTRFPTRRWQEGRFEYYTDIWGNLWHRLAGMSKGGEIHTPALADWGDLEELALPDFSDEALYKELAGRIAGAGERFRMGGMPGWVFATARYLRRMETYFMDLIEHRQEVDRLHERVCDALEGLIDAYGRFGLDGIFFCEDLGVQDRTLVGPRMWSEVFRPHYERLTARAHAAGLKVFMHSCGYNRALLEPLMDAGIDCFQFDQPALYDMPELAAILRKRGVGLYSPCDIQKVLPTGDRERIVRETTRLVETFRGGLIAKNYGDLPGIGVDPAWDRLAYETFLKVGAPGEGGEDARS